MSAPARRAAYAGTKVVAVAKNYGAHKVEMGGSPERLPVPSVFLKPNSSVIGPGQPIVKPAGIGVLHHEVELGVVIGARCRRVPAAEWRRAVGGYVLGLDMTARDLQAAAKAGGLPWTYGKCFDTFTPLSGVLPADAVPDPHALELYLSVNGTTRQRGSTGDMLHRVPELVQFISSFMTLEPGDVILTGTPAGVGPVEAGDVIVAGITGLVEERWRVVGDDGDAAAAAR
jgi:acylpyruvate hydrolase